MPIKMADRVGAETPARTGAQTRTRLSGIEAGRGVAATIVVLYHAARHIDKIHPSPLLAQAFRFGHAGVDFFFVISGFIILHVHAADIGRPGRLAHYAARRFTRVFPTYWVALGLTLALVIAGQRHALPSTSYIINSVLLLPSHTPPLLGIAWTLQYEIVFYAVFAVLILNRMAGRSLLILWLAWITLAIAGLAAAFLPNSLYGAYNLEFFAGMAAALLLANIRIRAPGLLLWGGIVAFAAAAMAEDAGWLDGYANTARFAYGLAAMLIVLGSVASSARPPPLLRALGTASYSIYLFQFMFIGLAWHVLSITGLDRLLPTPVSFCVLAACGVAGGVAMSWGVEYPLMRWLRKKEGRFFFF